MQRPQFLLFVGDVHLGRRPGRVPADLAAEGVDPRALSPRAAFDAVIEEALALGARAVVFLGDVVDAEDHFLEAYSVLERGVRRLVKAGVEVLAVAGNHDVRALPRLVGGVPGFRLLGGGGCWEEHVLAGPSGEPLVRLVGWSFPRPKVTESPLAGLGELALVPRAEIPTIGLLHCDLDQRSSPYAPVMQRDLEAVMVVDAWLLGHVHAPSYEALATPRPVGYLGSLVGLDPSETGVHGPWRLALDGGRAFQLQQLALAPLAWAVIDVSVEEIKDADEIEPALTAALRGFAEGGGERFSSARAVGCKLRLVGRSPAHRQLAARARGLATEDLRLERDGRLYFVDRLEDDARAALDLEEIARSGDPPGLLASKLLALDRGEPVGTRLVHEARERLLRLADRRPWVSLDTPRPDDEAVRAHLRRAGEKALEELLAQREVRA